MSGWELIDLFRDALHSVIDEAAPDLEKVGLHPKAFFLLLALERCSHPHELAEQLYLPPPSVTFIVKQLESIGLVERRMEPADLRKYKLAATPKGKQALKAGQRALDESMERRLKKLSKKELEELRRVLKKFGEEE